MISMHTVFHAIKSILIAIILIYSGLMGLMYLFQSRLVYMPLKDLEAFPSDIGLKYENLNIQTADAVRISAWYIPALNRRGTILVCHGNAGNISHRLDTIRIFNELGLDVIIFDYRGYGQSQGHPSEAGSYLDAAAACQWLLDEKGVPQSELIIMGRSLGGAVATKLARDHSPKALILESTFTSAQDLGAGIYPWLPVKMLLRYDYPTLAMISGISCPVLLIHSPEDEIVPFDMGQRLYEAVSSPKEFLTISGGHNEGFLLSEKKYREGLDVWLGKVIK